MDFGRVPRVQQERGAEADGATADDEATCFGQGPIHASLRHSHRTPAAGQGFGENGFLGRDSIRDRNEVAGRNREQFGETPLAWRHGDDLPCRPKVVPVRATGRALAAGHQWIDRDAASRARTLQHGAGHFVAEDKGSRAAFVMPGPCVHVRAADADMADPDQCVLATLGRRLIAVIESLGAGVDERLHFAVYPPSTWRS